MDDSEDTSFITESSGFAEGKVSAFSTTHWSIVQGVGQDNPALAAVALERLCRIPNS